MVVDGKVLVKGEVVIELVDDMYLQILHIHYLHPHLRHSHHLSSSISIIYIVRLTTPPSGLSMLVPAPSCQTTIPCPTHIKSSIPTSLTPPSHLPRLKGRRAPRAHRVLPPSFISYSIVHANDASQSTKIEIFQMTWIDPTNMFMHHRCSKRIRKTLSCGTH